MKTICLHTINCRSEPKEKKSDVEEKYPLEIKPKIPYHNEDRYQQTNQQTALGFSGSSVVTGEF